MDIAGSADRETAMRNVRTVLRSHEKTAGWKKPNQKEREFDSYIIDGLNTSHDIKDVVSAMKSLENKKNMSDSEIISLKGIKNLAPGDFAVVKDQMSFKEPAAITHWMMIEALANEARYKKKFNSLGF